MALAVGGLWAAFQFDTPIDPAIVTVAATLLLSKTALGALRSAV